MNDYDKTFPVNIAGIQRSLPVIEIKPGLRIAVLNILGDTELVQAASKALSDMLDDFEYSVLVTAEAKSIPLAHAVSVASRKPYVVLRKSHKPYMGESLCAETLSITTGKPQMLYLDEKDFSLVSKNSVVLLDDVISTGSTLEGMRLLMEQAQAKIVGESAILTEGDKNQWKNIY
ncbi:MAG: phosphoribosyltransferase family protein, partial [Chloroflexota bacterium]|nr:phosphoribosyltransferase family protein [Chloroflexota bacterium]